MSKHNNQSVELKSFLQHMQIESRFAKMEQEKSKVSQQTEGFLKTDREENSDD